MFERTKGTAVADQRPLDKSATLLGLGLKVEGFESGTEKF